MEPLLDIVLGILASIGWRMWVCLFASLVVASIFVGYDIAVFGRYDVALVVVFLGIGTGVFWEATSRELRQR